MVLVEVALSLLLLVASYQRTFNIIEQYQIVTVWIFDAQWELSCLLAFDLLAFIVVIALQIILC